MKRTIRLTETDLIRLVKKVIRENLDKNFVRVGTWHSHISIPENTLSDIANELGIDETNLRLNYGEEQEIGRGTEYVWVEIDKNILSELINETGMSESEVSKIVNKCVDNNTIDQIEKLRKRHNVDRERDKMNVMKQKEKEDYSNSLRGKIRRFMTDW